VEIVRDKAAMQRHAATRRGARVGFVPTMGALHAGHLTLLDHARPGCDLVVASVFVNPTQFGPGEDFERYPRDLDADAHELERAGCDLLFAPSAADMYAADAATRVEVADLQDVLCGASRPGHFRGVATVVAKLFNLVQPQVAVFGQKDAQQAVILQRMVRDLDFPVEIRVAPIVRDTDGVALSSRNAYLSADERRDARLLRAALDAAVAALAGGARSAAAVTAAMRAVLAGGAAVRLDYTAVVDAATLRPLDTLSGRVLVAVAAFVGRTRLIDNVVLDVRGDAVREVGLGV
jgi:pantoate--beta-alanine ligase